MFQVNFVFSNPECFRYSRSPARPSSPPGGLEPPSSSDEEKVKKMQLCQDEKLKRKFIFSCGVSLIEIHVLTFLLFAQKALLWLSLIKLTDKGKTAHFNLIDQLSGNSRHRSLTLKLKDCLLMHVNKFSKHGGQG